MSKFQKKPMQSSPEVVLKTPQNPEAEALLLASIMLDEGALDVASDRIEASDFYDSLHAEIFRAMQQLHESGKPIDVATLFVSLGSVKLFEERGGMRYLADLVSNVPAPNNAARYAELIRNASLLRKAIEIADQAKTAAQLPMEDVSSFLDDLNQKTFSLTLQNTSKPYFTLPEVMDSTFRNLSNLYENKDQLPGIPSGFIDFDRMTAGFKPGTLSIVAARPAMGKTALALNFLTNAAIDHHTPAAFFSLEMTKEELGNRIISSRAQVRGEALRTGRMSDKEWEKVLGIIEQLKTAQIFVDETPAISITRLSAKARRMKAESNIGLIVIDYLQLMTGSAYTPSREQEISEISRSLKGLAKELSIPVIALAQLNRGVESRADKRPMLQDLRESGAIEQDADMITFIYRDDYYNPEKSKEKGVSEIIIAKQRSGKTGVVKLRWFGEYTLFVNYTDEQFDG